MSTINTLFDRDIFRPIQEVIKVDQQDDSVVIQEIEEYVPTPAIRKSFTGILESYAESKNKPSEQMASWVSGFFGSGKSSFAKLLGIAIENRDLEGTPAGRRIAQKFHDSRTDVVLSTIGEKLPSEVVIFDLATDAGVRNSDQKLTEIIYRQLLEHLGYAKDLDLAELEIGLEEDGALEQFRQAFLEHIGKEWDTRKSMTAFAMSEASRVLHEMDAANYPAADSWAKSARNRFDLSANDLAERSVELLSRRRGDRRLVFVIDEAGQFVARDVNKMLDLQGIVQALGRVARGRVWVIVTSQEKLNEMVGSLDDKRVEQARLMDRFPDHLRVHLEPSDISTVTSERVLSKNADAEKSLRQLFEQHRGKLSHCAQPQADVKLEELSADNFIRLYPLLPYQIRLIIDIVSGLRTQGGAIAHVGGANRTVIKLSQQLLTHPEVGLAGKPVGSLVTLDSVFDLVRGNIASDIRDKIDRIAQEVEHPAALAVAKAICLLQFVPQIKRTPESIAAVLHPAVDADSRLPEINEALQALEHARLIRKGDDGYRIPSPSEDDWEKQRAGLSPRSPEIAKVIGDQVEQLWQPAPTHELAETRVFKASLVLNGRQRVAGDIDFELRTLPEDNGYEDRVTEIRRESQRDQGKVFWAVPISKAIDLSAEEICRSQDMATKKRSASTEAEVRLLGEEKRRLQRQQEELKRLIREACSNGTIYFRGNDRSPTQGESEVGKIASTRMKAALPEVFERFGEAACRVQKKDIEALLTNENLKGLPPIFTQLKLVSIQGGRGRVNAEQSPLHDVLARIESVANYGNAASGRSLEADFGAPPFGWDFEIVKLLTLCLLRDGKIAAVSQGRTIETVPSDEAKDLFGSNPKFRGATFRPKKAIDAKELMAAADNFKKTFGKDVPELNSASIASAIRDAASSHEDDLLEVRGILVADALPGGEVLAGAISQMKSLRSGSEEDAIQTFNTSFQSIREAIARAASLRGKLTEPNLETIRNARTAVTTMWPALSGEPDLDEPVQEAAELLKDLLQRETFFEQVPEISQRAAKIRDTYKQVFDQALADRTATYTDALSKLHSLDGWPRLSKEQQERIAMPLSSLAKDNTSATTPISQIRSETEACESRLATAIHEVNKINEGERLVKVKSTKYFANAIESPEQLDAALGALRADCENELGRGKIILIQ
tara:strand:- start:12312 stop:15848 length:3537 start_codon:yes stop_codon:yes gene_type:complete